MGTALAAKAGVGMVWCVNDGVLSCFESTPDTCVHGKHSMSWSQKEENTCIRIRPPFKDLVSFTTAQEGVLC